MGRLVQASSQIANTNKFTLSGWFRIPTALLVSNTDMHLFSFGDGGDDHNLENSEIRVRNVNNASDTLIEAYFSGPLFSDPEDNRYDIFGGNYDDAPMADTSGGSGNGFFYDQIAHRAALGSKIVKDQWYHLFVAADLSVADSISFIPQSRVTRSRKIDIYLDRDRLVGQYRLAVGLSIFTAGVTAPLPAFNFLASGLSMAIPSPDYRVSLQNGVEYDDLQVWFGTYVEPTSDNLDRFVKEVNGVGRKVSPSVAAEAFGEPTLLFKGGAEQFKTNRGTGGTFTKVGTLTDFTPTASYEVIA